MQLIDADGDGRTDLLVTTARPRPATIPLRFGGLWDRRSFQRYDSAPSFNLEDPEVRLVDLDGDGVTDAIRSGTRLECFFNDPDEGWNDTRWVERQALEEFPNVNFSDPRVKWADMTGDGLQDIVLVYDGNVEYWPNLGLRQLGQADLTCATAPASPTATIPSASWSATWMATAWPTSSTSTIRKVTLWINQSGNGWSDPIVITGTPPVSDMDAVRLVDLLGSGHQRRAVERGRRRTVARASMFFLDFTGGLKPYLLNEMDNHMGAVTRVAYAPSTRFYPGGREATRDALEDAAAVPGAGRGARRSDRRDLRAASSRPSTATTTATGTAPSGSFAASAWSSSSTPKSFETYHAAGAAPGDRPRSRRSTADPSRRRPLTKTWFHQGPVGDEFGDWQELDFGPASIWPGDPPVLEHTAAVNRLSRKASARAGASSATPCARCAAASCAPSCTRSTARDRQDRPYTVTEHCYGLREEIAAGSGRRRSGRASSSPTSLAQRTTQWERGDDPMTQFTFTGDYDDVRTAALADQHRGAAGPRLPRGRCRRRAVPGDAHGDDLRPAGRWRTLHRRSRGARDDATRFRTTAPTRSWTAEGHHRRRHRRCDANVIGQTLNFYDGDAFTGLPFGEVGDYGALVRTESLVLTDGRSCAKRIRRTIPFHRGGAAISGARWISVLA